MEALRNQAPWDAFMAALVPLIAEQMRWAIEAEREACAQIAEGLNGWGVPPFPELAEHIAAQIRAQNKS